MITFSDIFFIILFDIVTSIFFVHVALKYYVWPHIDEIHRVQSQLWGFGAEHEDRIEQRLSHLVNLENFVDNLQIVEVRN